MKAVILAGGFGTRISEETHLKPKPMIEIGGRPILWHIMKIYSSYGINDFVICLGYKGYIIKEYFANYFLHMSDVTFCMKENRMEVLQNYAEPWTVTLVDTGDDVMTGGRIANVKKYVDQEDFCVTYGDGVADVDVSELIKFHNQSGKKATLTATKPPGRFGALDIDNNLVHGFREKPEGDGGWVNGGFFVFKPDIFGYLDSDQTVLEREPLEALAREGQLASYAHNGFWQPMDTLRDKNILEERWSNNDAPWKLW